MFNDSRQNFKKLSKKLDFAPKYYLAVLLFKVGGAWLSNHAVYKIGLINK
jgi:hypothetical protein